MRFITKTMLSLTMSYIFGTLCIFPGSTPSAFAQVQELSGPNRTIGFQQRIKLVGSTSPRLVNVVDAGRASGNNSLLGVTLLLRQTQPQVEDLQNLLTEQQLRGSKHYHQWLSPHEYATRYGMDIDDIAKIETWLTSEGFSHFTLNSSHTTLSFDGNIARIEGAFSTEIHQYSVGNQLLLANAADLEIPSDILFFVSGVTNLNQFRPNPQAYLISIAPAHSELTSTYNRHFLSPTDLKKIYDFDPLTSKGFTGQGQHIAVVGQSSVDVGDVARFRTALGLVVRPPTLILVPNTGESMKRTGDELESDIDLEYGSAIAPDADISLVYTGSDASHNVFDALAYAIDQDIAPVISVSYGECESSLSENELKRMESILMQANSQGETVLVASGDLGATGCETADSQTQGLATRGLAVQYPASSQYVTSIGGTMLINTDSILYWATANTADDGSAQSYIPEQAWNESHAATKVSLLGSGGGASSLFTKPIWQIAPGVPSDGARDLPDMAMDAGTYDDGYVLCSSDQATRLQGSCSNGLFDSTNSSLTIAGGTSFGAPITAGIVALINQKLGTSRLGNLNPLLYSLSVEMPNAFHDITVGDNQQPCAAGSKDCSDTGTIGYVAAEGYDQVTGIGTPDVGQLAAAFATFANKPVQQMAIVLRQVESTVYINEATHIIATISSSDGTLDGTIQFFLDGIASGPTTILQNGTAAYTFYSSVSGARIVSAVFINNLTNVSIVADITVQVKISSGSLMGTFSLSSFPSDLVANYATTSLIMISPTDSYSGKVTFRAGTSNQYLLKYGCYAIQDVGIQSSTSVYTTLFVARSIDACKVLSSSLGVPTRTFLDIPLNTTDVKLSLSSSTLLLGLGFGNNFIELGAIIFLGVVGKKNRLRTASLVSLLFVITLCTGCTVMSTPEQAVPGTYVVVVSGVDTIHSSISRSISIPLILK